MTPADLARDNAISFECKKDALQQRQSGDWKISFTVQGVDMDERITRAAMGTRFVAVLVEIGDDEQPIRKEAMLNSRESSRLSPEPDNAQPQPDNPRPAGAKQGKRDWRDLPPATQAGMRCDEPAFEQYLKEERQDDWTEAQSARDAVCLICGVESRADLGANQKARMIWHQLDTAYAAWKALEHA